MDYLIYSQSTGWMTKGLDGTLIAMCWAGHGEGKNNPAMQHVHSTGPLPQGMYTIDKWEEQHHGLGPIVAHLTPDADTEMYGRSGFYIHGPATDQSKYGQESKGCIVIPRERRIIVRDSGITRLKVIA